MGVTDRIPPVINITDPIPTVINTLLTILNSVMVQINDPNTWSILQSTNKY
jgi:hypothetical protein